MILGGSVVGGRCGDKIVKNNSGRGGGDSVERGIEREDEEGGNVQMSGLNRGGGGGGGGGGGEGGGERTVRFDVPSSIYCSESVTDGEDTINGHIPSSSSTTANSNHSNQPATLLCCPIATQLICCNPCCCDLHSRQSKCILGAFISLVIAITWVAFTQLVQGVMEENHFNAPFSLTYFIAVCPILLFPCYITVSCLARFDHTKSILRDCLLMYRSHEEFKKLPFFWKSLTFALVSALTYYTYFRALIKLSAADCTALYAAHNSFVYLLSWIVLFEKFVAMRIFALIFSITGIVLFAYVDGFGSPAMFGVVMGVSSSAGAALYGLLYKKFLGEVNCAQASFFISVVGVFSLLFLWPIWLLLYLLDVEQIVWGSIPWGIVVTSAILSFLYSVLRECTVPLTYPVFIGLGLVLAIPMCAVTDTLWRGREFSGMKIAALVLITIGLLLILLPENWHDVICKHFKSRQRDSEVQAMDQNISLRGRLSRTSYM